MIKKNISAEALLLVASCCALSKPDTTPANMVGADAHAERIDDFALFKGAGAT